MSTTPNSPFSEALIAQLAGQGWTPEQIAELAKLSIANAKAQAKAAAASTTHVDRIRAMKVEHAKAKAIAKATGADKPKAPRICETPEYGVSIDSGWICFNPPKTLGKSTGSCNVSPEYAKWLMSVLPKAVDAVTVDPEYVALQTLNTK